MLLKLKGLLQKFKELIEINQTVAKVQGIDSKINCHSCTIKEYSSSQLQSRADRIPLVAYWFYLKDQLVFCLGTSSEIDQLNLLFTERVIPSHLDFFNSQEEIKSIRSSENWLYD